MRIEEVVVAAAVVAHLDDITARMTQSKREVLSGSVTIEATAVGVCLPSH